MYSCLQGGCGCVRCRYVATTHTKQGALPGLHKGADQLEKNADLLCQVSDLRILALRLGLLSNELGAEVILVAQKALAGLLQEVLLLLQLAQLDSQLCLHTATDYVWSQI